MNHRPPSPDTSRTNSRAEIFARALELAPTARDEFLVSACGHDGVLLAEMRSMILEHEKVGDFLAPRASAQDLSRSSSQVAQGAAASTVGEAIGHYQLLEVIGEGGFGVVYLAEQREPVRRQVALKVIKLGMDTRQVIARFDAERQALAMMDHPGIAHVFVAGSTQAGRPYFVMVLVRGDPITQYCDSGRLDTRARLELFVRVCLAVQHAHQKGVIHRDIKPSNVLVAPQDGFPAPKIIDFGIAKATSDDHPDRTVLTEQRQIMGTPAYMSPEQAGMTAGDIDTRSDIYSLGVLLYELLTGATPFDSGKLQNVSFDELMRIIREEVPVKPSTRISSVCTSGTQSTERRHTDARKLRTVLRGDLDWIVMKCLEKDRSRRYASAVALAEDIQRHLGDEPVNAGPPSATYRLRKFTRRYRGAVGASLFIALTLITATAVSSIYAWREAAARQREHEALGRQMAESGRANQAAAEALRQADIAQTAQRLAERRADETRQVADFQASMLRSLDARTLGKGIRDEFREQLRTGLEREHIQPERRPRTSDEVHVGLHAFDASASLVQMPDLARRVMDKYVLSSAAKAAGEQFIDQPLVQADIRHALGAAYEAVGLYDAAEAQYREALALRRRELGEKHLDVASNLNKIATILYNKGQFAEAEPLCLEALAIQQSLGADQGPQAATTYQNLAVLAHKSGDLEKAEKLYRQALTLSRISQVGKPQDSTYIMNGLAALLYFKGDLAGAKALYEESLEQQRTVHGNAHADIGLTLQNLAQVVRDSGDLEAAESMYREALSLLREFLGNEHAEVAKTMSNLASLLKARGTLEEAESLFRESLALNRKLLGNVHPDVANTLNNLAVLLRDRGDYIAAEPLYREAISILEASLPSGHWLIANSRAGLGRSLMKSSADLLLSSEVRAANLDEAELLLLSAEADYANAPPTPALAARHKKLLPWIIELYEARAASDPGKGYDQKVEQWKAKLQQLSASP